MQAVADTRGVDRTALHYYVGDRDALLELVVADLFETEIRVIELPDEVDWRETLRDYANLIWHGVLARCDGMSFRLSGIGGTASLAPAERVLRSLTGAGSDVDDVGRILTLVSGIALSAAHDFEFNLGGVIAGLEHALDD